MKKKLLLLAITAVLLSGCGKEAKLSNGEDAVVSFDGEMKISINDLYDEIKDKYAISTLVDMIDETILAKEYPDSTEDKEEYIAENVKGMKANYETEEQFLQVIKYYYGVNNEEEFKEYLAMNYMRNLAVKDYAKSLVKEKEIKAYYKDKVVGDIEASHILIGIDTDTTDEQALKKAQDLIKKLDKAKNLEETFAKLAKDNSDDTGSAAKGGELGYFNTGEMYQEFEKAAYALKDGEYTKTPVKTTVGYHIILKTDSKEKPTLEQSKEKILETLGSEKQTKEPTIQLDALTTLRKKYGLKIEDSTLSSQYATYLQNILYNIQNQ